MLKEPTDKEKIEILGLKIAKMEDLQAGRISPTAQLRETVIEAFKYFIKRSYPKDQPFDAESSMALSRSFLSGYWAGLNNWEKARFSGEMDRLYETGFFSEVVVDGEEVAKDQEKTG